MKLRLEGCSNAGFSLTEVRKEQILELSEWVDNHILDDKKTYKQIQDEIEKECMHLDGSKVRMLVPFLRKMGYVKNDGFEQRNSFIVLKNFFTAEGKSFIEYLKLIQKIVLLEREDINKKVTEIDELFNIMNMINLVSNGENIYIEIIEFLKKYVTMDKNEFFLMTTLKNKYQGEQYNMMLNKAVEKYRKKAFKRIEIVKHQNAYNYVKSFMVETNLVVQDGTLLKLNEKYLNMLSNI